jgi:hypothetical protein
MNPGLPGTGIGGLFYILSALLMPICEVRRRWQGDATGREALVARQFAIAVGVVAAMTAVFWVLDTVLMLDPVVAAKPSMWISPLRVSALLVTSCMLAIVLGAVQLMRLCLQLPPRPPSQARPDRQYQRRTARHARSGHVRRRHLFLGKQLGKTHRK